MVNGKDQQIHITYECQSNSYTEQEMTDAKSAFDRVIRYIWNTCVTEVVDENVRAEGNGE